MEIPMMPIPNYPDYYATADGEILSARIGPLRSLPKRLHNGYYRVNLRDRSHPVKTHAEPVHKLILEAFVGKRPENYVCRHLNGNPLDNRISNICWGTPKENTQDAIRHGTATCLRYGERAIGSKLKDDEVNEIRKLYSEGHTQSEIARVFSISQRHVSDIVRWKTRCRSATA